MHHPPRKHARPHMTAPGTPRPAPCKRSCARAPLAHVCTHRRPHAAVHSPPARRTATTSTGAGRQPRLTVADRATPVHNPTYNDPLVPTHARARLVVDRRSRATTEVCADEGGRFWGPWAEPAAVTDDPLTAACRVTAVLRPSGRAAGCLW
jgi:hypothetical protein